MHARMYVCMRACALKHALLVSRRPARPPRFPGKAGQIERIIMPLGPTQPCLMIPWRPGALEKGQSYSMHICIYTHTHVCIFTCVCIYIYMCVCALYTYIYIYVICICMRACVRRSLRAAVPAGRPRPPGGPPRRRRLQPPSQGRVAAGGAALLLVPGERGAPGGRLGPVVGQLVAPDVLGCVF